MYAIGYYDCETDRTQLILPDIYPNEYHAENFAEYLACVGSDEPPELRPFETLSGQKGVGYFVFQLDGRPTGCYYVCELNVVGPKEEHEGICVRNLAG